MKKIFGALFILMGSILTFGIIFGSIPFMLKEGSNKLQQGGADAIGYILGLFIALLLTCTLNFGLYFFGFKLLKNKKKELVPISDNDFPSQLT